MIEKARRRPHWRKINIEENLYEAIDALVRRKVVGVWSVAEFVSEAARKELQQYFKLGLHPWKPSHPIDDQRSKEKLGGPAREVKS